MSKVKCPVCGKLTGVIDKHMAQKHMGRCKVHDYYTGKRWGFRCWCGYRTTFQSMLTHLRVECGGEGGAAEHYLNCKLGVEK